MPRKQSDKTGTSPNEKGRAPGAGGCPALQTFLPGYQGGASWRGAFLASVTTDGSVRIPGRRLLVRRVLSVQTQHQVNAEMAYWFPLGMYRFLRDVDTRS
jgi:hypothetical protein